MTPESATGPKGVAVLGSTGSIGTTALRVLDRQRHRFRVTALTANSNSALLKEQAKQFSPSFVGMVESSADADNEWKSGTDALVAAATRDDVDIVLNAIVGAAGLDATLAALEKGKRVALANKETLVIAGHLVSEACASGRGEVIPVDSEHSAILQCITGHPASQVRRVILTASGDRSETGARSDWPLPQSRMLSGIRRGEWDERSRSTARLSPTRRSRLSRLIFCSDCLTIESK